ncbi:MAG TPA: CDP-alcohol phosphatidyltransferase family protein [bacterium]|nr:CDP-alcohol phosphatidyltransferase family protein [bacterium]
MSTLGLKPNGVTILGLLVTLLVPYEILRDQWFLAGFWLLIAGFFDVLDGALARNNGFQGPFGAFWDSTLDRVSEAFVFGGLILYYDQHQQQRALLLAFSVFITSFLVSYTRARAEGLGIDCEVGILPRPGRVVLLAAGFILGQPTAVLVLVGVLSLVTVIQRIHRVLSGTK